MRGERSPVPVPTAGDASGMRVALFYHSLVSDWNHGNAHFLRGVVGALQERGVDVRVFEPADGWSRTNLIADHGAAAVEAFARAYPGLRSDLYDAERLAGDLDDLLDGVDLVVVHEWNDPEVVAAIGAHRQRARSYRLLFHDTHHRAVTDPGAMAAYDLSGYDGVLAFGEVLRELYLREAWAERAWTWHEAADTRVFAPPDAHGPHEGDERGGDLVWIGNWGDGERSEELREYLLEPVRALDARALAHGVRYPREAEDALAAAGIESRGWLPNHRVPATFARYRVTVHVPRRPYVRALPGIPTIRPFEALACGIPLVCSPWDDAEGLFHPGSDYLVARDGVEMTRHLRAILSDVDLAAELSAHGRATILARHTCRHRVDELLAIAETLGGRPHAVRPQGAARAPAARQEPHG
jgi:spore maturation protein CgeB